MQPEKSEMYAMTHISWQIMTFELAFYQNYRLL